MSKKKWIKCYHCAHETWGHSIPDKPPMWFACSNCGGIVNLIKIKADQTKSRRAARKAKGAILGFQPKEKQIHREIDSDYIEWIKTLPCVISGVFGVDAHHSVRRSQGGSDRTCVPLSHDLHMELHTVGIDTFENKYDIDFKLIVQTLNRLFEEKLLKEKALSSPPEK
ncbi:MAG: DUF968 domain-containing protein [Pseudobdellovibrionaceae bacterium]